MNKSNPLVGDTQENLPWLSNIVSPGSKVTRTEPSSHFFVLAFSLCRLYPLQSWPQRTLSSGHFSGISTEEDEEQGHSTENQSEEERLGYWLNPRIKRRRRRWKIIPPDCLKREGGREKSLFRFLATLAGVWRVLPTGKEEEKSWKVSRRLWTVKFVIISLEPASSSGSSEPSRAEPGLDQKKKKKPRRRRPKSIDTSQATEGGDRRKAVTQLANRTERIISPRKNFFRLDRKFWAG